MPNKKKLPLTFDKFDYTSLGLQVTPQKILGPSNLPNTFLEGTTGALASEA